MNFKKTNQLNLKYSTEYSEDWVKDIISNDPSILGLGNLFLIERERKYYNEMSLDLLFRSTTSSKLYVVEVQLGQMDGDHLIRLIEYWKMEKLKSPNVPIIPVIVAEEITGRFIYTSIDLAENYGIIFIEMNAISDDEFIFINFKNIYRTNQSIHDVIENKIIFDMRYWINKLQISIGKFNMLTEILNKIDSNLCWNYKKDYIGVEENGEINNFFLIRKNKIGFRFEITLSDKVKINESLFDIMESDESKNLYKFNLESFNMEDYLDHLLSVLKIAFEESRYKFP